MKNRILNWGLLSTARINRGLIPAIRTSQRSSLSAVASRNLEKALGYAHKNNIPKCFGSYEALLNDPEIDVIYNSLPNHLHAEWTIKALQSGKHVLVEKPIALNKDDVFRIKEAAEGTGCIAVEAFMYRHLPRTRKVKELVENGTIGDLRIFTGAFTYQLTKSPDIRLEPDLGGGCLWDVGCYPLSFARMITGQLPLQVFGWQVKSTKGVDLTFAGQLIYSENLIAQIYSSFTLSFNTLVEIHGTGGSIVVPTPFTPREETKLIVKKGNEEKTFKFPPCELYLGEVEDIEQTILDGKKPLISLEESADNIATIQTLYQSAQTKHSVNMP